MLSSILPSELWLQIIEYLDRDCLKNIRLIDNSNSHYAAISLFRTIHLTPNTRSFNRARAIAASSHLSRHVKAVVFHVGILDDFPAGFESFRRYMMALHRLSKLTDSDILWQYNCFLEEIDGQRDFGIRDEGEELQSLCQQFDMLESITTVLDEEHPFTPPTDFIGQRTGCHSICSADGHHFSDLFNAVIGKSLTMINGGSMSWRCLDRVVQNSLQHVDLHTIKSLSLGLFNSEFLDLEAEDKTSALHALKTFLGAVSSSGELHALQLDFDELYEKFTEIEVTHISEVVFTSHWSSLRTLSLQGVATTEEALIEFLERHDVTLKNLHLDDIFLVDEVCYDIDGNISSRVGSILSLFRQINNRLHLESAQITGNFTNRRDEAWYADTKLQDSDCLRRKIESWLSHHGPSPFPEELTYPTNATHRLNAESWGSPGDLVHNKLGIWSDALIVDESWEWYEDLIL